MKAKFINEFDYKSLSKYEKCEFDCAEEFFAAGMSHMDIRKVMDDDEFQDDMQVYCDNGYDGQEYARMLLNKWSGVSRQELRENWQMEEKKGAKFQGSTIESIAWSNFGIGAWEIRTDKGVFYVDSTGRLLT